MKTTRKHVSINKNDGPCTHSRHKYYKLLYLLIIIWLTLAVVSTEISVCCTSPCLHSSSPLLTEHFELKQIKVWRQCTGGGLCVVGFCFCSGDMAANTKLRDDRDPFGLATDFTISATLAKVSGFRLRNDPCVIFWSNYSHDRQSFIELW